MPSERFARRLVRWFPLNWRARYEDEFVGLLDAAPSGWRTTLDVIHGCVSEWSHEISEQLVRGTNATGRFAGGLILILRFVLAAALFLPVFVAGNAVCSVVALALLQRGWTVPTGTGLVAYPLGLVLLVIAMRRRRSPQLSMVHPAMLTLYIFLDGVLVRMDTAYAQYALLSVRDLFALVPGLSFGYLVPDALWFRKPVLRTRPAWAAQPNHKALRLAAAKAARPSADMLL